jgi:hypothetical protein
MDKKLQNVEYRLFSKALATSDDKYFVAAYQIYYNLLWLAGEAGSGAGDVAGSADFGPTETAVSMVEMIEKDLSVAEADYHNLMDKDVPVFQRALADHGILPLTAPAVHVGDAN